MHSRASCQGSDRPFWPMVRCMVAGGSFAASSSGYSFLYLLFLFPSSGFGGLLVNDMEFVFSVFEQNHMA